MPSPLFIVTVVFALLHVISGMVTVSVGVACIARDDVINAHTSSPIWSGAFFMLTGFFGLACSKRRSSYLIMCFAALSVVSLVTAVVSIQLLRLSLVRKSGKSSTSSSTVGSQTGLQKNEQTTRRTAAPIWVALVVTGGECALCIITSFISCRLAKAAKDELQRKREGTYHVEEKDAMVTSPLPRNVNESSSRRENFFSRALSRI